MSLKWNTKDLLWLNWKKGRLFKMCYVFFCAMFLKLGCVIIHIDRIILRCISPIILRIKRGICNGLSLKEISATHTMNLLAIQSSERVVSAFQELKCRCLGVSFRLRIFLLGLIVYMVFIKFFFSPGNLLPASPDGGMASNYTLS